MRRKKIWPIFFLTKYLQTSSKPLAFNEKILDKFIKSLRNPKNLSLIRLSRRNGLKMKKNWKNNNLRKNKLKSLKSYAAFRILCFLFKKSNKLFQYKLYWKNKYVHLGLIWKSLESVIPRMCLEKRKRNKDWQLKKLMKMQIVQQTKQQLRRNIIRQIKTRTTGKWMGLLEDESSTKV